MKNKININGKDFTIEELNELIEKSTDQEQEKEQLFLKLFQGLQIKSDVEKYPDSVFYFRENNCVLEIQKQGLWVNYSKIWSIFEDKFNMQYDDIQSFIQNKVEKHFKWKGLTPIEFNTLLKDLVEKHFKWKGLTPISPNKTKRYEVEKHFKWKGLTPKAKTFSNHNKKD